GGGGAGGGRDLVEEGEAAGPRRAARRVAAPGQLGEQLGPAEVIESLGADPHGRYAARQVAPATRFFIMAALTAACGGSTPEQRPPPDPSPIGRTVDLILPSLDGDAVELASFRG